MPQHNLPIKKAQKPFCICITHTLNLHSHEVYIYVLCTERKNKFKLRRRGKKINKKEKRRRKYAPTVKEYFILWSILLRARTETRTGTCLVWPSQRVLPVLLTFFCSVSFSFYFYCFNVSYNSLLFFPLIFLFIYIPLLRFHFIFISIEKQKIFVLFIAKGNKNDNFWEERVKKKNQKQQQLHHIYSSIQVEIFMDAITFGKLKYNCMEHIEIVGHALQVVTPFLFKVNGQTCYGN